MLLSAWCWLAAWVRQARYRTDSHATWPWGRGWKISVSTAQTSGEWMGGCRANFSLLRRRSCGPVNHTHKHTYAHSLARNLVSCSAIGFFKTVFRLHESVVYFILIEVSVNYGHFLQHRSPGAQLSADRQRRRSHWITLVRKRNSHGPYDIERFVITEYISHSKDFGFRWLHLSKAGELMILWSRS